MRVAVTGAHGFVGWHLRAALRARNTDTVVAVGRELDTDPEALDRLLAGVDAVVHVAGVNRDEPTVLRDTNARLATRLTESLDRAGSAPTIVYANSIQAGNGTPYGDGKQAAADHLAAWGAAHHAPVVDVQLPNVFGEHGRPAYNSFVSTFCAELARGTAPTVVEDREVPLRHVQDVADDLIAALELSGSTVLEPAATMLTVTDVLARLSGFRDLYARGEIPDVVAPIDLALFNTYRSYCFPDLYPLRPTVNSDARGELFECLRAHGGQAQVFCSSTVPGAVRGNHFHRRKIERFQVLRGDALISLRKVLTGETVEYRVSGSDPGAVDMPTLWSHNIVNVGDTELLTLFWTADLLDPAAPDTYADTVDSDDHPTSAARTVR
jgi:UDP-2-acetamido-2,6-beta-L-arabino-hexul-4-ose reductase